MSTQFNRRRFLQTSAAATGGLLLTGNVARAFDLNGKLRLAAIGTGGRGRDDLLEIAASPRVEVVALCNVDQSQDHFGWAVEKWPKAAKYADYRKLLDQPNAFDAVMVSTPDHMHAPIALPAMELGKHCFCQKPLTHTVGEARQMRDAANRYKVVTQMGNQIQSHHAYRQGVQLIHDGAIGKVREVHSWQSGDLWWLPKEDVMPPVAAPPATLHWDLWLGVAPKRPFANTVYHPQTWRGWQDFGSGQLGDFGCHILDPVSMALDLGSPVSVEAEAPPFPKLIWGRKSKVSYQFEPTKYTVSSGKDGALFPLTWYDGDGHKPTAKDLGLPDNYDLPGGGSAFIGEAGTMVLPHWGEPRLLPEKKFKDKPLPPLEDLNHFTGWAEACLGDGKTTSNFDYAGPLTETVLLGNIAIRFPGEQLQWDSEAGKFTHHADATALVTTEYRKGW